MSVKKNLTLTTLAVLLAVLAFGVTNALHTLHMPSVTAHATDIGKNPTCLNKVVINICIMITLLR